MRKIIPLFALLFIAACATIPPHVESVDSSNPNLASMYFYLTGSYLHYDGDHKSADQLFHMALAQDPNSPNIKKQILINSSYLYMSGGLSPEEIREQLELAKSTITFDFEMLMAAYSVYNQLQDNEGIKWSLDELVCRYPEPRVYVQKFLFMRDRLGTTDNKLLETALQKSGADAELQYIIARIYASNNPDKAISVLQKIKGHVPADGFLVQMYVDGGFNKDLAKHFSGYSYPEDAAMMKAYLQILNQKRKFAEVCLLASSILTTEDVNLIEELCYAAMLQNETEILTQVNQFIHAKIPEPEADSRIAALLLSFALNHKDFPIDPELPDRIYSLSSAQDIFLYYALTSALKTGTTDIKTDFFFYRDFTDAVDERLPESLLKDYLKNLIHETTATEISLPRFSFAYSLTQKLWGEISDYSTALQYLYDAQNTPLRIEVLRKAILRFPNEAMFLNDLGYTLLENPANYNEAESLISKALQKEPESLYYTDSMAWLQYLKGDYQKAAEHLPTLLKSENPPSEIRYHIARIYMALGEKENASLQLQKVLEDSTNPSYQEKAEKALKELGM